MAFNDIRKKTPCRFSDGITQQGFEYLANYLAKKIKRITNIWVDGAIVHCTVVSQRHISEWNFSVDFNDWGHVTGTFWTDSENHDSSIPQNFGMRLSRLIHELLNEQKLHLHDLSDNVDNHENLNHLIANGIHSRRGFWRYFGVEALANKRQIVVNHSDWEMKGEHLYPIFALLMDNGFENISVQKINDVDENSSYYEYEVAQISIAGNTSFEYEKSFDYNSEVVITYHAKKEIEIPFRLKSLILQNYNIALNRLQKLGFTQIYVRLIKDLVAGIIIKDGDTEKIVVKEADGTEVALQNGKSYPYDTHIIICYHTFK